MLPDGTGSAPSERMLYRAMYAAASGLPVTGPKDLGVRPKVDVRLDASGVVSPGRGMSVAPDDPMLLPDHLRPTYLGGDSDRAAWSIPLEAIRLPLLYTQDKPSHGIIGPAEQMTLDEYIKLLEQTARDWTMVDG
jgi:hypothetical protein